MFKLYEFKPYNYGFVVLCPNCNIGHLKNTISSIELYYPQNKMVVVLPDSCKKENLSAKTLSGGSTVSSLINAGMKSAPCKEWNFIIVTSGWMKHKIDIKYSYFIESETDVLYPVLSKVNNFIDADINGMLIHKKTFDAIGEFPDTNSIRNSKLIWANKALQQGSKFKGIIGARIF
jgi:hypothetical protein